MATRLHKRGVRGIAAIGRVRDIGLIGKMCATYTTTGPGGKEEMPFCVWSKGTSTVGPALQCRPWCVDVPLIMKDGEGEGGLVVRPGDFLFADEVERGVVVVPKGVAEEVVRVLPMFKDSDDIRVRDVQAGKGILETVKAWPG